MIFRSLLAMAVMALAFGAMACGEATVSEDKTPQASANTSLPALHYYQLSKA